MKKVYKVAKMYSSIMKQSQSGYRYPPSVFVDADFGYKAFYNGEGGAKYIEKFLKEGNNPPPVLKLQQTVFGLVYQSLKGNKKELYTKEYILNFAQYVIDKAKYQTDAEMLYDNAYNVLEPGPWQK